MSRSATLVLASSVIAVILACLSLLDARGLKRVRRLDADIQARVTKNRALQEENEKLRREIRSMEHDPQAIERAAREELGLVKEGEVVFAF